MTITKSVWFHVLGIIGFIYIYLFINKNAHLLYMLMSMGHNLMSEVLFVFQC